MHVSRPLRSTPNGSPNGNPNGPHLPQTDPL